MNKRKVAVIVEGQTELFFVRDLLYLWYGYDANRVGIACHQLRGEKENIVPFSIGSLDDSEVFYRIIDVGGDGSVVSAIKRKYAQMYANLNYDLLIGLRDMFSAKYHSLAKGRHIDRSVNESMIAMHNAQLPTDIAICSIKFAIMETEAWMLAMPGLLTRIDQRLTYGYIKHSLGCDLSEDIEQTIYHPASLFERILGLVGKKYDKDSEMVSTITAQIDKQECLNLYNSNRCYSFHDFLLTLLGSDITV